METSSSSKEYSSACEQEHHHFFHYFLLKNCLKLLLSYQNSSTNFSVDKQIYLQIVSALKVM